MTPSYRKSGILTFQSFLFFLASAIIFLALLQGALAVNDFLAYADSEISACSCGGNGEGRIFITNGDFENVFSIDAKGSGAGLAQVYPSSFALQPGEKTTVSELVTVPCKEGSYELTLTIKTDTNLLKEIRQKIVSSACSNINVRLAYANNSGCMCNTFTYIFNATNTGNYYENYMFSAENSEAHIEISPENANIAPGKSRLISLSATPDCNSKSSSIDFSASSEKGGFAQKIPLKMLINSSCHGTQPKATYSLKNYLKDTLVYFPIVILIFIALLIIIALIIAYLRMRKAKQEELPIAMKEEKQKPYWWKERFKAQKTEEPIEGKENSGMKVAFFLILILMILVILVLATDKIFHFADSGNQTANNTVSIKQELNESGNNSIKPAATASNQTLNHTGFFSSLRNKVNSIFSSNRTNASQSKSNETKKANQSQSNNSGATTSASSPGSLLMKLKIFASAYYVYAIIGLIALILIIAAIELLGLRKK